MWLPAAANANLDADIRVVAAVWVASNDEQQTRHQLGPCRVMGVQGAFTVAPAFALRPISANPTLCAVSDTGDYTIARPQAVLPIEGRLGVHSASSLSTSGSWSI